MQQADFAQVSGHLFKKLFPVNKDKDFSTFGSGMVGNIRKNDGFSRSGGSDQQGRFVPPGICLSALLNYLVLVIPKGEIERHDVNNVINDFKKVK